MPGLPILCCKGQRSKSAALPFAAENEKLVFVEYLLSLRASAHTGVAIPRLEGRCADECPEKPEDCHTSVRAGSQ